MFAVLFERYQLLLIFLIRLKFSDFKVSVWEFYGSRYCEFLETAFRSGHTIQAV
jgi:hypothetical protein